MVKTTNVLDRDNEINKVIKVFERNKEFDFFYDREKEEGFLRKIKKSIQENMKKLKIILI